jgi:hypothetical protein
MAAEVEIESRSEPPKISWINRSPASAYWFRRPVHRARLAPRKVHVKIEEKSIDCRIEERRDGFLWFL